LREQRGSYVDRGTGKEFFDCDFVSQQLFDIGTQADGVVGCGATSLN